MIGVISRPRRKTEFARITNVGKISRRKTKNTCVKSGTAGSDCPRTSGIDSSSATTSNDAIVIVIDSSS